MSWVSKIPLLIARRCPPWARERLKGSYRALFRGLRRRAFRRVLRAADAHSAYYRKKFLEHGIDVGRVRGPEDLGEFYLTAEDLRRSPEALLCGEPDLAIESSGTTGHAVTIFLSHEEMDYHARQGNLLKAVYGLSPEDRVISTFDHGFCLDGLLAQRVIRDWGVFGVAAGRVDPVEIYRRLPSYRFNVVMSGAPWLARFTEVAESEGRPYPLKLLIGGGGGGIPRRTREWIENFWGASLCMTYGFTEAATLLGFECLHRKGYHLNDLDFCIEVVDPDAEGYGEVVVTTLRRKVMPLIRYRTRDVARLLPGPCSCGLPLRLLSPLRGRADEIVASVWGNVHPDFFEKILGSVPGITDEWQVAVQERGGKQTFEFRVETQDDSQRAERIEEAILNAIQREHPLAWQGYQQRLAGVDFTIHRKGTLRTGRKLLRLVDERGMAERRSA